MVKGNTVHSIGPAQLRIMRDVRDGGPIHIYNNSVQRAALRLCDRGLMDRRGHTYFLTASGREALAEAEKKWPKREEAGETDG
jgi:hypothetical protein